MPCIVRDTFRAHNFRCVGTFSNYMGYLRTASVDLDVACPAADHLALKHAKIAILKRMLFTPRSVAPDTERVQLGRIAVSACTGQRCSCRR